MNLVSVIIPTYNRSELLSRAIKSVLTQSYSDYELIVVDDCSMDDTKDVVAGFNNKRIRYIRLGKNSGGSMIPRQAGLEISKGKYIASLDDGDFWIDKYKLSLQVLYLEGHPECVMVGTDAIIFNGDGSVRTHLHYPKTYIEIKNKLLMQQCFLHSSVMYRKEALLDVGGYSTYEGGYYMNYTDEYATWLRMGLVGELVNLPIYGVGYVFPQQRNPGMKDRICFMIRHIKLMSKYKKYYPNYLRANIYSLVITMFVLPLLPMIRKVTRKY